MNEDQIYISTKLWFKKNNYIIIGGQPPSGSDTIPVVEIKDKSNQDKGSKGSYKPDLIVKKDNSIVILECKPKFDIGDKKKLLDISDNDQRKKELFIELTQRKLINKDKIIEEIDYSDFLKNIRYCMSFKGGYEMLEKIAILNIFNEDGDAKLVQPKINKYNIPI